MQRTIRALDSVLQIGHSKCRPTRCFEQIAFRQRIDYLLSQLFSEHFIQNDTNAVRIQMFELAFCTFFNADAHSQRHHPEHSPPNPVLYPACNSHVYKTNGAVIYTGDSNAAGNNVETMMMMSSSTQEFSRIPFRVSLIRSRFSNFQSPPPFHSIAPNPFVHSVIPSGSFKFLRGSP